MHDVFPFHCLSVYQKRKQYVVIPSNFTTDVNIQLTLLLKLSQRSLLKGYVSICVCVCVYSVVQTTEDCQAFLARVVFATSVKQHRFYLANKVTSLVLSLAHDIAVAAAVLPLCYDKESSPRRERRKSHELMSEPVQLNVILWLQILAGDPGSPLLFLQVCMLQVWKYQSNTTDSSLEAITCHLTFSIINTHA